MTKSSMKLTPDLPIAISLINGRHFLFSTDVVSYVRREHHICGVLVGSIPQIPQQNVFLGLPLELMPEEAHLLVDKNVAYIIDDVRAHDEGLRNLDRNRRQEYLAGLRQAGERAAKSQAEFRGHKKEQALKKRGLMPRSEDVLKPSEEAFVSDKEVSQGNSGSTSVPARDDSVVDRDDLLFSTSPPTPTPPSNTAKNKLSTRQSQSFTALAMTPATSHPLVSVPPPSSFQGPSLIPNTVQTPSPLPILPKSYPLFTHLHSRGYFLSPGLRFGCQYVVYPGDPLRFHSHFLAVGVEWEQEIDLMEIVGGGRLGTGVKKGYLIGGVEPVEEQSDFVRTFSVEWAVM